MYHMAIPSGKRRQNALCFLVLPLKSAFGANLRFYCHNEKTFSWIISKQTKFSTVFSCIS